MLWLPTTKKEVEQRGWQQLDVIYHPNMKAYGLQQLVLLYINWKNLGNDNLGMTTRAFQGTPFN